MSSVDQVIILAAGKSLQLDGVSKSLIRHPTNGRTVLEYAIDAFEGKQITVVVGFRAIQIMQSYPDLAYVHNPDWALTNNAMSLGLALNDKPAYVISGDIFIGPELVRRLDSGPPDMALVSDREKRALSAIHCVIDDKEQIVETYQGPIRDMAHPESLGIFKVSHPDLLRAWRQRCFEHSNLFAGQLIPCDDWPVAIERLDSEFYYEVNTPTDYLELIRLSSNK